MGERVCLIHRDKLMVDELIDIARAKLKDASELYRVSRYEGACYIAGYTVECIVKYLFLKEFQCIYFCKDTIGSFVKKKGTEQNFKRIYDREITDYTFDVFDKQYTELEIAELQEDLKEIYDKVLTKHAYKRGVDLYSSKKNKPIPIQQYRFIFDWSEEWRYRLISKDTIVDHDINDQLFCKSFMEDILLFIEYLKENGIIKQFQYHKLNIQEVAECIETSVLQDS